MRIRRGSTYLLLNTKQAYLYTSKHFLNVGLLYYLHFYLIPLLLCLFTLLLSIETSPNFLHVSLLTWCLRMSSAFTARAQRSIGRPHTIYINSVICCRFQREKKKLCVVGCQGGNENIITSMAGHLNYIC